MGEIPTLSSSIICNMYVTRNSGLCVCVLANFRPDNLGFGDVVATKILRLGPGRVGGAQGSGNQKCGFQNVRVAALTSFVV